MDLIDLQLFGGRGGSSGGSGKGIGGAVDVEHFAQDLFESRKKKDLDEVYSWLQSDLKEEKETGEWDVDQSYWVIDKNGNEYFFDGYSGNNADTRKQFKKNDIAYISHQGPDGREDSIGYGYRDEKSSRKISDDAGYSDRYDSEINRLFGTRWGKKHPR